MNKRVMVADSGGTISTDRPLPIGGSIPHPDDAILHDAALWDVVSSGDLKGLTPAQRSAYYLYRCRQEGLNPASQPFTYMVLNGKGILYANKTAADQLRKMHGISIVDLTYEDTGEYLTYEITMQDREGRRDIDVGQVFVGTAKGEQRANARMKAITKAKRRATYSICGTGTLDETEIETIPGSKTYEDLKDAGFPERSQTQALSSGVWNPLTGLNDADVSEEFDTGDLPPNVEERRRDLWAQAELLGYDWAHFNKIRREAKMPELELMEMEHVKTMYAALLEHPTRPFLPKPAQGTLVDAEHRVVDRYTGEGDRS
jgi:hypothetical protein